MSRGSYRRAEPYFHDDATHQLIERIAGANSLTIFAGAGISLDRGSLTWNVLVAQLLAEQLHHGEPSGTQQSTLDGATALAESLGPIAAASAVRELYHRQHRRVDETALMQFIAQDIYDRLYPKKRWSPGGALAEAIVRLAVFWKSLGREVAILTTNYDSNIEDFAGDEEMRAIAREKRISIRPRVDRTRVGRSTIPVYHLNGYIPYDEESRGNLAFSESGLALGQEVVGEEAPRLDWRARLLEERFRSSTTVFVGTTLRDPTVVGGLIRTREGGATCPRYGIFPYQGDAWCDGEEDVRIAANAALEARLAHLGVEPIRPDFYGQVAQLLNEILHCRMNCSGKYTRANDVDQRYGGRLVVWWTAWDQAVRQTWETKAYQDKCQERLAKAVDDISSALRPGRSELLKLEIWIRANPSKRRELALWGTSEAAIRSLRGAARGQIENQSKYPSVRALCQGFDLRGPIRAKDSRWQSHFSVPIVLQGAPWQRLPVGVMNLLSSKPEPTSCLSRLDDPDVWAATREIITAAGVALLDPASCEWSPDEED